MKEAIKALPPRAGLNFCCKGASVLVWQWESYSPPARLLNVKDKLAANEPVYSMTVRLVRSIEIATIARTAGFDTIYIDLEHNVFSLDAAGQICIACLSLGIAPFVRVPSYDPHFVARVLDLGALGVIAPHVQSAADAEAVVRAARYPPVGERSLAGMLPQLHYRTLPAEEANQQLNDATMVIGMIESPKALPQSTRSPRFRSGHPVHRNG